MTKHRPPVSDRRSAAAGDVHPFSRSLSAALAVVFALLAALIAAPQGLAAPDETLLVSRASGADGAAGNDRSGSSSISADGRYVAFGSYASNLHPDDTDKKSDVFVRDLEENTTTLVSRATGADGVAGNEQSHRASISADGRFVAFDSSATNLHPDDTDNKLDVFVRDLEENTTTLVSRATGADGAAGNDHSSGQISADGRFVGFDSSATNLHPDDTDNKLDVFVRDLEENTTTLVSRATGAHGAAGNGDSSFASISADGRYVAFDSCANNFHAGAMISCGERDFGFGRLHQIFVRDLEENTTTLVSRATGADGLAGNDHSFPAASISADGRLVAIESCATNLVPDALEGCTGDPILGEQIFVRDLEEKTTMLVSRGADASSRSPSISAEGRFVAYYSFPTIFVRDLEENTTTLASRASGRCGATMGSSWDSSISAAGRFVAFSSLPDTSSQNWQVFRRDLSLRRKSPKRPAELEITQAQVGAGRLVVEGSLDPAAAGARVAVRFRAAGKQLRLRPTVRADGQFRASGRLRGAQRRGGAGRLVVRYAGSETLRATTERLRAARRAVRLRIVRATRNGALGYGLALAGRVLRQARGRVRIEIEFTRPDCSAAAIADRVKVNRQGRFRLRRNLPPAARGMDLLVSVTHPGRGRLYGQRLSQACPSRPGELGADAVRCASVSQADGR